MNMKTYFNLIKMNNREITFFIGEAGKHGSVENEAFGFTLCKFGYSV